MSGMKAAIKATLAKFMLIVEFCDNCGKTQPLVWTASDELWYQVTGRDDGGGVLCPKCFDDKAHELGIFLRWMPVVEAKDES